VSESSQNESSWGAVRAHEPEPGIIVFEAIPAPERPPEPGEPRTPIEAFTLWQERKAESVIIRKVEFTEREGAIAAIRVRYSAALSTRSYLVSVTDDPDSPRTTVTYEIASDHLQREGRAITYTYSESDRLLCVSEGGTPEADQETNQEPASEPARESTRAHTFVVTVRDGRGRRFGRAFAVRADASTTLNSPEQLDLAFAALANAIDMIPLLSGRWRQAWASDRAGEGTTYEHDETRGVVRVENVADGNVEEFAVPPDHRLVRMVDPETKQVTHVVEPVGHEVVFEFGVAGCLERAHPKGSVRRVL
jgi:hypothetical protein